ncbi:MAG TPA: P1 family peptidase [Actinomycetales bacterium]|nr:P1 family peptidase [Actinomycetales bacterium]
MSGSGPTNSLVDVTGLAVGHATRRGDGWLTGTTVVLAGADGAVAGVDVRGGGPGTRETDLLDPRNVVERVHAVVLTGGSAFGLAAADGVMTELEARGTGLPVGSAGAIVPIVPAAVVFDLGRGGDLAKRPDATLGAEAARTASGEAVREGSVGAGTGAVAGGLKGGVGSASQVLDDGTTVAALAVVNAAGSPVDRATGLLWAHAHLRPDEQPRLPDDAAVGRLRTATTPPEPTLGTATTLLVVATDATLSKAQCAKAAGLAHDGLARAISPVHTMVDGDTAFALATCARPSPDMVQLHLLLTAAGDVACRAVARAVLAAEPVSTAAGRWPSYGSLLHGGAAAR